MIRSVLLWVASFSGVLASAPPTWGALIGLEFTGKVTFAFFVPAYGISLPINTTVAGNAIFDTETSPIPLTNSSRYVQERPGGFAIQFGSHTYVADKYVINVGNNVPQANGTFRDVFSLEWRSNHADLIGTQLLVDNSPKSTGLLRLNFTGGPTIFSDTSLPTSLVLSSFSDTLSYLAENPSGAFNNLFTVSSLETFEVSGGVPEPSTFILTALGLMGCLRIAVRGR